MIPLSQSSLALFRTRRFVVLLVSRTVLSDCLPVRPSPFITFSELPSVKQRVRVPSRRESACEPRRAARAQEGDPRCESASSAPRVRRLPASLTDVTSSVVRVDKVSRVRRRDPPRFARLFSSSSALPPSTTSASRELCLTRESPSSFLDHCLACDMGQDALCRLGCATGALGRRRP